MSASDLDWGSVSDWLSGVATVIAVVVALVFSLRAERDQRDSKLAAVYAWFAIPQTESAQGGNLWVKNDTASPLYEWSVTVTWPMSKGDTATVSTGHGDHGLLPPGTHYFPLTGTEARPLPANDADVQVEITFKDAQGRTLRRLATGKLVDL